jgi:hypothetical protein
MSNSDTIAINTRMGNIFTQMSNITGNSTSTYNLLSRVIGQQSNISNLIYNGSGNIITGNIIINDLLNINGNLAYSNLNLTGNFLINNGNISATIGNIVLSNGNILSTRGNIVLSNGNILSTRGNINMSNGNINLDIGNLIVPNGDANIVGTLYSTGISTILGQPAFKVQYGITPIVTTSTTVTFDTPFTTVPTVLLTVLRDTTSPPIGYIRGLTTIDVDFFAKDRSGGNYGAPIQFMWVAFGI